MDLTILYTGILCLQVSLETSRQRVPFVYILYIFFSKPQNSLKFSPEKCVEKGKARSCLLDWRFE